MSTTVRGIEGAGASESIWRRPVRLVIGGAAMLGIAGICVAGAVATSEHDAAVTQALAQQGEDMFYPDFVRTRLSNTFYSLAGGLGATALAAAGTFQSGLFARMAAANPMVLFGGTLIGTIASMMICRSIDWNTSPVAKLAAFGAFTGIMGMSLAPVCMMAGPIVGRAALYTGGIVGGLSLVAANSPNDRFLKMGGTLGIGLGVVVVASFGSMFFPASPLLHNVALYGGLALFSGFVLYDTSRIIAHAKLLSDAQFDPINECIGLYMDTINIFIRLVQIMSGSSRRR